MCESWLTLGPLSPATTPGMASNYRWARESIDIYALNTNTSYMRLIAHKQREQPPETSHRARITQLHDKEVHTMAHALAIIQLRSHDGVCSMAAGIADPPLGAHGRAVGVARRV